MTARDQIPVVLAIGDTRVYCVGCKSWQPTEGYCEGDPDICPIGEEDQGRSPSLAEAQHAIDLLAKELSDLDESAAQQIAAMQARPETTGLYAEIDKLEAWQREICELLTPPGDEGPLFAELAAARVRELVRIEDTAPPSVVRAAYSASSSTPRPLRSPAVDDETVAFNAFRAGYLAIAPQTPNYFDRVMAADKAAHAYIADLVARRSPESVPAIPEPETGR